MVGSLRIVGPGRAGRSLALAMHRAGWQVEPLLGRGDDLSGAAQGVDILVLATPDAAVSSVAATVRPVPGTVVAHLSGALGLSELAPHERRAAIHPVVALPQPELGAERLVGAWYVLTGDPFAGELVSALQGRVVEVADEARVLHHAASVVAANHLVALMGQVKRIAGVAEVPFEVYLELAQGALDGVKELGPEAALTGPVARGDEATVARHVRALPPSERPAYEALAGQARRLAAETRRGSAGREER